MSPFSLFKDDVRVHHNISGRQHRDDVFFRGTKPLRNIGKYLLARQVTGKSCLTLAWIEPALKLSARSVLVATGPRILLLAQRLQVSTKHVAEILDHRSSCALIAGVGTSTETAFMMQGPHMAHLACEASSDGIPSPP